MVHNLLVMRMGSQYPGCAHGSGASARLTLKLSLDLEAGMLGWLPRVSPRKALGQARHVPDTPLNSDDLVSACPCM